jgi:hypothetical protein
VLQTSGCVSLVDAHTARITELPPRRSIDACKATLQAMQAEGTIRGFRERHTEREMEFEVTSPTPLPADPDALTAWFRLSAPLSLSNMHLFDAGGHIQRYATAEEILLAHAPVRLRLYERRHARLVAVLEKDLDRARRRRAFLRAVVAGELPLLGQPRAAVVAAMARLSIVATDALDTASAVRPRLFALGQAAWPARLMRMPWGVGNAAPSLILGGGSDGRQSAGDAAECAHGRAAGGNGHGGGAVAARTRRHCATHARAAMGGRPRGLP